MRLYDALTLIFSVFSFPLLLPFLPFPLIYLANMSLQMLLDNLICWNKGIELNTFFYVRFPSFLLECFMAGLKQHKNESLL